MYVTRRFCNRLYSCLGIPEISVDIITRLRAKQSIPGSNKRNLYSPERAERLRDTRAHYSMDTEGKAAQA